MEGRSHISSGRIERIRVFEKLLGELEESLTDSGQPEREVKMSSEQALIKNS